MLRQDGFSPVKICSSSTAVALATARGAVSVLALRGTINEEEVFGARVCGRMHMCVCGACETGHITCFDGGFAPPTQFCADRR